MSWRPTVLLLLGSLVLLVAGCGADTSDADTEPVVVPAGEPLRDTLSAGSLAGISQDEIGLTLPWTTGSLNRATDPGAASRTIDGVELAEGDGFDRFVVTFQDDARHFPGYHLEYLDGQTSDCSTEEVLTVRGQERLQLSLTGARAHDDSQNTAGDRTLRGGSEHLNAVHRTCDYSGNVTWVFDLAGASAYRIMELSDPTRLVVDVRHPPLMR